MRATGSINLYSMIDDKFGNAPSLNEEKFKQAVYDGIIALDEIVSYGYETQPLDENRTCIDDWRSLGLGLFGVADALVAMTLAYGSRDASAFMENVMKIMLLSALFCDRAKMKVLGRYRRGAAEKMVKELDGGLYEDIELMVCGTVRSLPSRRQNHFLLMGSFRRL
ncbi:MAG: hypothetical protein ACLUIQ_12585 [Dialister invisus]